MKKAADDLPLFFPQPPRFLTVSELNEIIKGTLEEELGSLWVVGEISNFRIPPSGHYYFTLKDERSQIAAVMFRRQGLELAFVPENGMEILCFGKVGLYSLRGDLQLYVETMEPRGQGALYVAFEQLKKKLSAEGFFAEAMRQRDRNRICGLSPIYGLLRLQPPGSGRLLHYGQWPDPEGTVTFASVAFEDEAPLR